MSGSPANKNQILEDTWYHTKDLNREYYTPFSGYKREWVQIGDDTTAQQKVDFVNSRGNDQYRSVAYETMDMFNAVTHTPLKTPVSLEPNIYRYEDANYNIDLPERLEVIDSREDDYIPLGGPFAVLDEEIKRFLEAKDYFKSKNMIHKRGILLYGPPGNGKTVYIRRVIEQAPADSVTIMIRDDLPEPVFLDKLRNSLQGRLKIFVFEELAITARRDSQTECLLNFLDGCDSMDDMLVLATTNYPEKLPGNIVDRPSRIDTVIEIGNPDKETLGVLMSNFLDRKVTEEEVTSALGLSIAGVKEACLLTHMKGMTVAKAVKTNKDRSKLVKQAFAKTIDVGFGFGS